jgi:hypothetical protein
MMMCLDRINARDRRRAAIHEAGHAVIAEHVGAAVTSVYIAPSEEDDATFNKSWIGRTQFARLQHLSRIRQRMVACAGATAQAVWHSRIWPVRTGITCVEDLDFCEPAFMSGTDWELAGCEPGEPDNRLFKAIERVWTLLDGELWPALCRKARSLIEEARY